ncbi:divalent-cation tolerance protein CutA [Lacipirellula parvula]|uniref:Periplasmic divalent cation tolerance protein CutA n=1 Tax=Lacipirellula parvula TaxID=2650471 RepID=A0A5K7XCP0_9BACT|nr:divalent-cation tolerance protein CutA [Lacipirellula parvula]BBO30859.1 periplasmic divalent cation tolerance protein CutA [Lacipirellula parvula]
MNDSSPLFIQIATTAGSREEADRIATALVDRSLAACVQIVGPMQSVYRWQGQIDRSEEWLCQIKTTRQHYAAVEAAIRELHSYECPEVIATPIVAGSAAYLQWLAEQTS